MKKLICLMLLILFFVGCWNGAEKTPEKKQKNITNLQISILSMGTSHSNYSTKISIRFLDSDKKKHLARVFTSKFAASDIMAYINEKISSGDDKIFITGTEDEQGIITLRSINFDGRVVYHLE